MTYFLVHTHPDFGVVGMNGPFESYDEAKNLINEEAKEDGVVSKVLTEVTHATNKYGAPKEYQGVSYPAPIDNYSDGEDG